MLNAVIAHRGCLFAYCLHIVQRCNLMRACQGYWLSLRVAHMHEKSWSFQLVLHCKIGTFGMSPGILGHFSILYLLWLSPRLLGRWASLSVSRRRLLTWCHRSKWKVPLPPSGTPRRGIQTVPGLLSQRPACTVTAGNRIWSRAAGKCSTVWIFPTSKCALHAATYYI